MDHIGAQVKQEVRAPAANAPAWKRLLGYAFAVACAVWVFHDIHPRQLLSAMIIRNWWLVALAVSFDILTYVLQGIRWKLLLAPVGRLSPLRATQAIYAGLFTNEVVPLRFGELVRAFLAARWLNSRLTAVFPSMVVERFLDALWLAVGIGLAAIFLPLPHNLVEAGDLLGMFVLIATAVFLVVVLRKEKEIARGEHLSRRSRVSGFLDDLAGGLRNIGISRRLVAAATLSAAMLACQALATWFMLLACDIRLHVIAGFVVLLVIRVGTAIPNAPANVGSFQFFAVVALALFGVEKTRAAAFSVIDFAALTAPLWIIGLFAFARAGLTLGSVRQQIARLRA